MDIQGVAGGVEILRKPLTPSRSRRKLSIPAILPQGVTGLGEPHAQAAFRRRFSNVGDAVSRKLSTTIGWRGGLITINASPPEEVVAVGRALCTLYIRTRLKKAGLFNKKLGLTRVRSAIGTLIGCGNIVREVFPGTKWGCIMGLFTKHSWMSNRCKFEQASISRLDDMKGLSQACQELERMYPKLYNNIWRHTGPPPAEGTVGILLAIGHHMLRTEPTWGKVLAIYCVAAGLSVDCVRQGQSEQLHVILEDMSELLEDKIAAWVHANGGWTGLNAHCRPKNQEVSITEYITIFGVVTIILLVAYFIVRFCVRFGG